jgi:hypothetical protein
MRVSLIRDRDYAICAYVQYDLIFHLILPDLTQEILLDGPNRKNLILLHPTSNQLYTDFSILLDNFVIGPITLWGCVWIEFHICMYELFCQPFPLEIL